MSTLDFADWPTGHNKACLPGDIVSLVPVDPGVMSLLSYVITTAPGGSSATFANGQITPDVDGYYLFTVTAGLATATRTLYRFATGVLSYPDIAKTRNGDATRSNASIRRLLEALANSLTPTELVAYNSSPQLPSRVNMYAIGA